MLELHVGEFVGDHSCGDPPPQAGRLQHVRLVHRCKASTPRTRQLGAHAYDALDLLRFVYAEIRRALAVTGLHQRFLPEVDATRQFANDEEIDSLQSLRPNWRRRHQRGLRLHGPQIRVKSQRSTDPKESLLRSHMRRGVVPLGPAYGAKENGVGAAAHADRFTGERAARGIDGRSADETFAEGERDTRRIGDGVEYPSGLRDDLWSD